MRRRPSKRRGPARHGSSAFGAAPAARAPAKVVAAGRAGEWLVVGAARRKRAGIGRRRGGVRAASCRISRGVPGEAAGFVGRRHGAVVLPAFAAALLWVLFVVLPSVLLAALLWVLFAVLPSARLLAAPGRRADRTISQRLSKR